MAKVANETLESLAQVSRDDVNNLFTRDTAVLHAKVDQTRDAYLGFIFPINRSDFIAVAHALDLSDDAARALYKLGTAFSTFRVKQRGTGTLTNHIVGSSILALRGKPLDSGLNAVTDRNIEEIVRKYEGIVLEIAEARSTWFGRIYFPAAAFASAIRVFGGSVTPDGFFNIAERYGFAATAGDRRTVRGDFGIGVWLMLLGCAP